MSRLGSALALLLAVAAVGAHLRVAPTDFPAALFAQGGFASLAEAEEAAARGDVAEALRQYRVAFGRTTRLGLASTARRVRYGLGACGRRLVLEKRDAAWPLLAAYALWSEDFASESRRAEAWALENGAAGPAFDYTLVGLDGRTPSGDAPDRTPLWVLRLFPASWRWDEWSKPKFYVRKGELPPDGAVGQVYFVGLRTGECAGESSLHLLCTRPDGYRWSSWFAGAFQPFPDGPGDERTLKLGRDVWIVDRLFVRGPGGPPPFRLVLRRTYQPL